MLPPTWRTWASRRLTAGRRQPRQPIQPPRTMDLMPMRVREVIRLPEKHGWVEMRSKGSHRHFRHPTEALVITVPGNDGKELGRQG